MSMSKKKDVSFRPATKTSQDDFDVLIDNVVVGTLWKKRNHPKPNDIVLVFRSLEGDVSIHPNETSGVHWLLGLLPQTPSKGS